MFTHDQGIPVQFCVNIVKNTCVHERELEHDFDQHHEKLRARTNHEGAILIGAPEQLVVRIEDDLQAAIPNICFASIPPLMAGKHYAYSYFSMYGIVSFDPEGHDVKIAGDYIPTTHVPRLDLLRPLYHCGLRFIEYFQRLRGDEWHEMIDGFMAEAEVAKRALSRG